MQDPTHRLAPRSLFVRYWLVTSLLAAALVAAFGAVEIFASYRHNRESALQLQRAQAEAAAALIEQRLDAVARALQEVALLPWGDGLLGEQARRDEFARLLKRADYLRDVAAYGADGGERLFVSRSGLDRIGDDGRTRVAPNASGATGWGVSEVFFERGSDPHVRMVLAGFDPVADSMVVTLNLRFATDLVRSMGVSGRARTYVVASDGTVIAHPQLKHVLVGTSADRLPWVAAGLERLANGRQPVLLSDRGGGLDGDDVFASVAAVRSARWLVAVEQPVDEVFAPVAQSALRSLATLAAALLLALAASSWLARRLAAPIRALKEDVDRFGAGELARRATAAGGGDELASLASAFNRMAAQIEEYAGSLEAKVAEKTRELALANEHKSRFLAHVSHELKTPLNAILGFSEALQAKLFGDLNDKQLEYVSDIHGSGRHLLSLIKELLDLSSIEAGKMALSPAPCDLAPVLDSALALVREQAKRGGVVLARDLPDDLGVWVTDEQRLRQVLLNLLGNAIKFTRSGGAVRLAARQAGDEVRIEVSDTGIGIAEHDLQRLFEPFTRLEGARGAEGTGLGLALSRRLVELLGGRIEVRSREGEGSTFTVLLSRQREAG